MILKLQNERKIKERSKRKNEGREQLASGNSKTNMMIEEGKEYGIVETNKADTK
jgi:hypothetical protein